MSDSKSQEKQVSAALKLACRDRFGVIDAGFLCQSIGILDIRSPIVVEETTQLSHVLGLLRENKIGCVLVTDHSGKLTGIFSERDFILKILDWSEQSNLPISQMMTRDPVSQSPECTIAFALQLMSQGGFRHLPIVDDSGAPVGLLSVKDVIDYIVQSYTEDLLNFDISGLALDPIT